MFYAPMGKVVLIFLNLKWFGLCSYGSISPKKSYLFDLAFQMKCKYFEILWNNFNSWGWSIRRTILVMGYIYICVILCIAIFVHRKLHINLYLCGKFKGKKYNAWVSLKILNIMWLECVNVKRRRSFWRIFKIHEESCNR